MIILNIIYAFIALIGCFTVFLAALGYRDHMRIKRYRMEQTQTEVV